MTSPMDCNAKVNGKTFCQKPEWRYAFFKYSIEVEVLLSCSFSNLCLFIFNAPCHPNPPSMVMVRQQLTDTLRKKGFALNQLEIDSKANKIISLCTISYIYIIYDDNDKDRSERGFFYQAIHNPTLSDHCELYGFWKPTCKIMLHIPWPHMMIEVKMVKDQRTKDIPKTTCFGTAFMLLAHPSIGPHPFFWEWEKKNPVKRTLGCHVFSRTLKHLYWNDCFYQATSFTTSPTTFATPPVAPTNSGVADLPGAEYMLGEPGPPKRKLVQLAERRDYDLTRGMALGRLPTDTCCGHRSNPSPTHTSSQTCISDHLELRSQGAICLVCVVLPGSVFHVFSFWYVSFSFFDVVWRIGVIFLSFQCVWLSLCYLASVLRPKDATTRPF